MRHLSFKRHRFATQYLAPNPLLSVHDLREGSNKTVTLQWLSIETCDGLNLALSIEEMELRAL